MSLMALQAFFWQKGAGSWPHYPVHPFKVR
ncbi:hypothetical protein F0726_02255 [Acidithiobacillus caldus]|nr:hypothetical protein F0726_02255 [Acidithiobacillus caldus]